MNSNSTMKRMVQVIEKHFVSRPQRQAIDACFDNRAHYDMRAWRHTPTTTCVLRNLQGVGNSGGHTEKRIAELEAMFKARGKRVLCRLRPARPDPALNNTHHLTIIYLGSLSAAGAGAAKPSTATPVAKKTVQVKPVRYDHGSRNPLTVKDRTLVENYLAKELNLSATHIRSSIRTINANSGSTTYRFDAGFYMPNKKLLQLTRKWCDWRRQQGFRCDRMYYRTPRQPQLPLRVVLKVGDRYGVRK